MSCMTNEDHNKLVRLKADVVGKIRNTMKSKGAVESYYNKITGGTGACFVSGTKITVEDGGFKLIEDIKEGDLVLTHKGRLRRGVKLRNRYVEEEI